MKNRTIIDVTIPYSNILLINNCLSRLDYNSNFLVICICNQSSREVDKVHKMFWSIGQIDFLKLTN